MSAEFRDHLTDALLYFTREALHEIAQGDVILLEGPLNTTEYKIKDKIFHCIYTNGKRTHYVTYIVQEMP